MKRAFPREADLASSHQLAAGSNTEPSKQGLTGGNRRARTSAAMIGLALSMGASGALLPRHGDGAVAAESISTEAAIAALPQDSRVSPLTEFSTGADTSAAVTHHTVREGQTLWQIAQEHRVNVEALASYNGMSPNQVLQVGQILTVPGSNVISSVSQPVVPSPSRFDRAELEAPPAGEVHVAAAQLGMGGSLSQFEEEDARLKAEQDEALANLRQKRSELNEGLARLQSNSAEASSNSATTAEQPATESGERAVAVRPTSSENPVAYYPFEAVRPSQSSTAVTPETEESSATLETESEPQQDAIAVAPTQSSALSVPSLIEEVSEVPEATTAPAASSSSFDTEANLELSSEIQISQIQSSPAQVAAASRATDTGISVSPTPSEAQATLEPQAVEQNSDRDIAAQDTTAREESQIATTPTPEVQAPITIGTLPANLQTTAQIGASREATLPTLPTLEPTETKTEVQTLTVNPAVPTLPSNSQVASNSIQVPVLQPETASEPTTYRIQQGDTLSAIARRYGVSRDELARLNNISNPNLILAGATLSLPSRPANQQPIQSSSQPVAVASNVLSSGVVDSDATEANLSAPTVSQTPGRVVVPTIPSLQPPSDKGEIVISTLPSANAEESFSSPLMQSSQEGTTTLAAAPLANDSSEKPEPASIRRSDEPRFSTYAENLLAEIRAMRAQREAEQAGQTANTGTEVEVIAARPNAITEPTLPSVAPTMIPGRDAETPALEAPAERRPNRPEATAPARTAPVEEPQLMAAAPLGSESYAPLAEPLTGRVVSPELPALPGAGEFLPENPTSRGYIWPAQGVFTSGYGWRWGRMHRGIDVAAPVGTPVVASASGVVISAGWNSGGYGNLVEIRHSDGTLTRYAHNNRLLVRAGQQVRQGQQIAEMGSTGYSTGPHVHFEIHPPNQGAVNPMAYLPAQ